VAAERRILLLSPASRIAPALRQVAAERHLHLVQASDVATAYERLRNDRFACAILDLDALGDGVHEFIARARGLRPGLPAVAFGRLPTNGARPAAQALDLPLLAKPLSHDVLARVLDASLGEPAAMAPAASEAARVRHQRVAQLERSARLLPGDAARLPAGAWCGDPALQP
jgi:DNA-binding NtrC family response regulator